MSWVRAHGFKASALLRVALCAVADALPGQHPQAMPTRMADIGNGVIIAITDDPKGVSRGFERIGMTVTRSHVVIAVHGSDAQTPKV